MPTLSRINLHPVKSFDAQAVESAVVLPSGALEHDRRFVLCDRQGEYINGKGRPEIHRLRSDFDLSARVWSLRIEQTTETHRFHIDTQRAELLAWLGDYFATPVTLMENPDAGFPDDTDSPGPTLISTATLSEVGYWFGLDQDETRQRFRANLEIEGVEPFWEDRLVAEGMGVVRFQIGEAEMLGTNPCQRCVVPSRSPTTGETIGAFAKTFSGKRQATLPPWAPASRFDHFYRLSVNTRPVNSRPSTIRVGDELRILEND